MKSTKIINITNHLTIATNNFSQDMAIKFKPNQIEDIEAILFNKLGIVKKIQSGVYMLTGSFGVYVGESDDLKGRMKSHLDNEEKQGIEYITWAFAKSNIDEMEKNEIKDIESILLENVKSYNLTYINKKNEKRKIKNNVANKHISQYRASKIWDQFTHLNIMELISSYEVENDELIEKIEEIQQDKRTRQNFIDGLETKEIQPKPIEIDHDIFQYINRLPFVPISYVGKQRVFNKILTIKFLKKLLYHDENALNFEKEYTTLQTPRGFTAARTLALLGISTKSKILRGSLFNKGLSLKESYDLIEDFVDKTY